MANVLARLVLCEANRNRDAGNQGLKLVGLVLQQVALASQKILVHFVLRLRRHQGVAQLRDFFNRQPVAGTMKLAARQLPQRHGQPTRDQQGEIDTEQQAGNRRCQGEENRLAICRIDLALRYAHQRRPGG